jgi:hypothetical protein
MKLNEDEANQVSKEIVDVFQNNSVPIMDSILVMIRLLAATQMSTGVPVEMFWDQVISAGKHFSNEIGEHINEH